MNFTIQINCIQEEGAFKSREAKERDKNRRKEIANADLFGIYNNLFFMRFPNTRRYKIKINFRIIFDTKFQWFIISLLKNLNLA